LHKKSHRQSAIILNRQSATANIHVHSAIPDDVEILGMTLF